MYLLLILLTELILLIIPINVYDKYLILILAVGALLQMWLFQRYEKKVLKKKKSGGLGLIALAFAIINVAAYQLRNEYVFQNYEVVTTDGTIVKRYRTGGGRTSVRNYLKYNFKAEGKTYEHANEVNYKVYAYYFTRNKIKVDYIKGSPTISRINKASLIEDPRYDELVKKANEEYHRQRREKQKKD